MNCSVDDQASPDLARCIKKLSRDYPSIESDLARLYEDIAKDHTKVQQGHPVPTYDGKVWYYRCESSDMNRGKSGGFRVLGYFREEANTMYIFCVFPKDLYEKLPGQVPHRDDIKRWIKNLLSLLMPKSGDD